MTTQTTSAPQVSAIPLTLPLPTPGVSPVWASPHDDPKSQKILIVDDEELNIRVARKYLRTSGYEQIHGTTEAFDAVDRVLSDQPDLVLLDIMMPDVNGLEILKQLRSNESTRLLPIVILTAHFDNEIRQQALEQGANDFLAKPIDPVELLPRVRNLLALRIHQKWLRNISERLEAEIQRRTAALIRAEQNIVNCLARAAEYRDNETGRHVVRVGRYAALIGRTLGLESKHVELLEEAAKLHDVGKIGIPDSILLKMGRLDPDELETMREHCGMGLEILSQTTSTDLDAFRRHVQMGANILDVNDSPLLAMASQIAMTHHEKWDGSGYPFGLSGEQIPLEGRIVAVADVFDALSSRRPYKAAFPLEKCYQILEEGRGKHFDPRILDSFLANKSAVVAIQLQFSDA